MSRVYVLSLQTQLEEAVAGERKNLSGNVTVPEQLFQEQNQQALEANFPGVFAFIGFHPAVDKNVTSYLQSGSLSSDSGSNILVLFTLDTHATSPVSLNAGSFQRWISLDTSVQPSYTLIRSMFKDPTVLTFPGVVFFEHFIQSQNPVYVPLPDISSEDAVRQHMRKVFALAEKVYLLSHKKNKSFLDRFAQALLAEKISYERGGDISAREWFVKALRFLNERRGDIVSIVQLFKP